MVTWGVQFLADNHPDIAVRSGIAALLQAGLGSLISQFGDRSELARLATITQKTSS